MKRPSLLATGLAAFAGTALLAFLLWNREPAPIPLEGEADLPSFDRKARYSAPAPAPSSAPTAEAAGDFVEAPRRADPVGPDPRLAEIELRIERERGRQASLRERLASLDDRGAESAERRTAREEIDDYHVLVALWALTLQKGTEGVLRLAGSILERMPDRSDLADLRTLVEREDAAAVVEWARARADFERVTRANLSLMSGIVLRAGEYLPVFEQDLRHPDRSHQTIEWLDHLYGSADLAPMDRAEARRVVIATLGDPSVPQRVQLAHAFTSAGVDPDLEAAVRACALEALAPTPDDDEGQTNRWVAILTLAETPGPETTEILERVLASEVDPDMRQRIQSILDERAAGK